MTRLLGFSFVAVMAFSSAGCVVRPRPVEPRYEVRREPHHEERREEKREHHEEEREEHGH